MRTNKLFFYGLLLSLTLFSCKEKNVPESPEIILDEFGKLLNIYGLLNSDYNYEGCSYTVNDSMIFFNGRLENKLHISCFNRFDKSNVFSWSEPVDLDTLLIIDEGYGESTTHYIDQFELRTPCYYNNDFAFILWGLAHGNQYETDPRLISSDLYLVSNLHCEKLESLTYPSGSYYYERILPWFQNSIIVSLSSNVNICYSMEGNELFEVKTWLSYIPSERDLFVSSEEFVNFGGSIKGTFYRMNIKTDSIVWHSAAPFADLQEDTRIDKTSVSVEETGFILFNIDYTLYNGVKNFRRIKVNIETGQFLIL